MPMQLKTRVRRPLDMLVKLYALPDETPLRKQLAQHQTTVRRAMAHEKEVVVSWVENQFGATAKGWKSECDIAFSRSPIACQIAIREKKLLGFACHDVAAKNFFGPIGVGEEYRLRGLGTLLLLATLRCMREQGYAYAIIGHAGPDEFFAHTVGAIEIPGSTPGIYPLDTVT